ncbi:MAG: PspC domain-containing protein [Alistipes sp.]|nr:PspC domain-containing protein [Alistipes sp.]
MNEVKKCSISGVAFTLDIDAYEELERYLESLRQAYKNSPDGTEIVADIEARIAELILSAQDGGRVVEKPLVLNIIRQLGTAQDISEENEHPDADLQSESPRIPRRLYRDIENAKLGGVCAGLGKYFGLDAVWIRLSVFVPVILQIIIGSHGWFGNIFGNIFGVFLLSYLVMWFAVPVARSARQKLEMNGEPVTARTVADTTAAAANDVDVKAKSVVAETVSVLGKVVLILLKLFAGFIVFALICAACGLIIGLISVAVGGHEFLGLSPHEFSIWLPIFGILVALVPVFLLIYVLMCLIASRKPGGKTILATFLLWIATIVACVVLGLRSDYTDGVRHLFRGNNVRVETSRPDMEELEQQLEELESYSIDIRDSTNNVSITVRSNRPVRNKPSDTARQPQRDTVRKP